MRLYVLLALLLITLPSEAERIGGSVDHVGLSSTCSGDCNCSPEGTCKTKHSCECLAKLREAGLTRSTTGRNIEITPDPDYPGCVECQYTSHAVEVHFACYGEGGLGCDEHLIASWAQGLMIPISPTGTTKWPGKGPIQDEYTRVADAAEHAGHMWEFEIRNRMLVIKCATECEHANVNAYLYDE